MGKFFICRRIQLKFRLRLHLKCWNDWGEFELAWAKSKNNIAENSFALGHETHNNLITMRPSQKLIENDLLWMVSEIHLFTFILTKKYNMLFLFPSKTISLIYKLSVRHFRSQMRLHIFVGLHLDPNCLQKSSSVFIICQYQARVNYLQQVVLCITNFSRDTNLSVVCTVANRLEPRPGPK